MKIEGWQCVSKSAGGNNTVMIYSFMNLYQNKVESSFDYFDFAVKSGCFCLLSHEHNNFENKSLLISLLKLSTKDILVLLCTSRHQPECGRAPSRDWFSLRAAETPKGSKQLASLQVEGLLVLHGSQTDVRC